MNKKTHQTQEDSRQLEFKFLCDKKASDFEFAWNGFVRIYEDKKKDKPLIKKLDFKRGYKEKIESCDICKNEKVACVCIESENALE